MPTALERVDVAYALVTDPTAQRVLLVRDRRSGKWGLPGGRREDGETLPEAAARKALEEAGAPVPVPAGLISAFASVAAWAGLACPRAGPWASAAWSAWPRRPGGW
ncbi:NUDIX hydrolase [Streptomyces kaniharaensis]|uniref:NUDIX hydrolase n=1 Tax=Streptomyces kaniharaensis TaxID=212423 RepID=A0A6N7L3N1_9ACTN|nr:NUDIX hydrolase [Streptomyces kaniharaensis]